MLDHHQSDRFKALFQFLGVASSALIGTGIVMLLLGLSCKLVVWGYCSLELVPLFGRDPRLPQEIPMINLPLAMMVLGLGIRLYSPYGWWIITILLMVLTTFFGFLLFFHWNTWPFVEVIPDVWERVPLLRHPDADAVVTTMLFTLLLLFAQFFWWSGELRHLYFSNPEPS